MTRPGRVDTLAAMRRLALLMMIAAFTAAAENLLANPGFEQLDGEMPAQWSLFVAPMDGADGRVDPANAFSGRYSVRLHNPQVYEREPANNWSQNIVAKLAGKELLVSAVIKTQDATEAAIWVQCFRRHPWALLKLFTTSTDSPVYGTTDWVPVEMHVGVPDETDFVVIRCVLIGQGTAWFDALAVRDLDLSSAGLADPRKPSRPLSPSSGPEAPPSGPRPNGLDTSGAAAADSARDGARVFGGGSLSPGDMSRAQDLLMEAHRELTRTNDALRAANEALAIQLQALQGELRELRQEIGGLQNEAHSTAPRGEVPRPVPPLVPHGVDWERVLP